MISGAPAQLLADKGNVEASRSSSLLESSAVDAFDQLSTDPVRVYRVSGETVVLWWNEVRSGH